MVLRLILLSLIILCAGCGGEHYAYESAQETQPGPGVFSGEDGAFTLYESSVDSEKPE